MHKTIALLVYGGLLIANAAVAESPLLGLATQLRDMGRPEACAVEALRHWHTVPTDHAQALQLATSCLISAGRPSAALRLLQQPEVASELAANPALLTRRCLLQAVLAPEVALPDGCSPVQAADPVRVQAGASVAMRALAQDQWPAAEAALEAEPAHPILAPWQQQSRRWLVQAAELPSPSPWAAALLSAAVPGLGRVYVGKWQDGLPSLALIGLPAMFAAQGFANNGRESARGWILGSVAAVLYGGNVVGSYVAAQVVTAQAVAQLHADVRSGLLQRLEQ